MLPFLSKLQGLKLIKAELKKPLLLALVSDLLAISSKQINKYSYLFIRISDVWIELFSIIHKAFIIRFDNTTFDSHRPCSDYIISSHHTHSNTSLLTLPYSIWYLAIKDKLSRECCEKNIWNFASMKGREIFLSSSITANIEDSSLHFSVLFFFTHKTYKQIKLVSWHNWF